MTTLWLAAGRAQPGGEQRDGAFTGEGPCDMRSSAKSSVAHVAATDQPCIWTRCDRTRRPARRREAHRAGQLLDPGMRLPTLMFHDDEAQAVLLEQVNISRPSRCGPVAGPR
jgi:hypothetical protein